MSNSYLLQIDKSVLKALDKLSLKAYKQVSCSSSKWVYEDGKGAGRKEQGERVKHLY